MVIALAMVALTVVMASTGPAPEVEITGLIRRSGGPCLQLERWGLFGWDIVGQTYSVADVEDANWHDPPQSNPPCADVPEGSFLVRMPSDAPSDVYRLCGLADDRPCLEFTMVEPEGTPGP